MSLRSYRAKIVAAKRADAVEAAREAFIEQGYAGASMAEIARRAELSTATLYKRFPSKAALFAAVMEAAIADAVAAHPAAPADDTGALEAELRAAARAYARLLSQPAIRAIARVVIAERPRFPELADALYEAVKSRLHHGLEARLEEAAARGEFDGPPVLAAGQLFGMIEHATLLRGLIIGDDAAPLVPPDQIADEACATFLARWRRP